MYDVLPKVLPQALNDVLPKVLPQALNEILPKVMHAFLEKAMHQNLYNVHGTASDSPNIKDKTEKVDNKDSEAVKPDGHPPKVNECADKKEKPEEVDNKDFEAPIRDEYAPKVDEFKVAAEVSNVVAAPSVGVRWGCEYEMELRDVGFGSEICESTNMRSRSCLAFGKPTKMGVWVLNFG
ncbi:hypothetical protein LWI28_024422 [Acer negundo]|uniref:Uncharacterized protein n=1 Tax=Acer negundo TaxID=4023 RepID=A0AAD5NSZ1_ACENE|nr:hypothetical protein LWI28_024422 [Acer negundo]